MSIDSTQLANTLNLLERVVKEDSISKIQYQSLIDTINNGIVVHTDWWMWVITTINALAFIVLTYVIYKTNKIQNNTQIEIQNQALKLNIRREYYDLNTQLWLVKNCIDGVILNFASYFVSHESSDYRNEVNRIYKGFQQSDINARFLLMPEEFKQYEHIKLYFKLFADYIPDLSNQGRPSYYVHISDDEFLSEDRQIRIKVVNDIINKSDMCNFKVSNAFIYLVKFIDEYRLHEVTAKYCSIPKIMER